MSAEDATTVAKWMDAWMMVPKAPGGRLELGRFADPIYFLGQPISWQPNPGQVFAAVTVPTGFVTDFASIPAIFWSYLRPDGKYAYAAIVHDYLYWMQQRPREEADQILKFAMQDFNINSATVLAIYEAVHLFGGSAWRNNADLKARGEKRILKPEKWPEDPRVTWAEWKKRPDVFA
jgi:hypothetical protein